jgi:hypothetical protein
MIGDLICLLKMGQDLTKIVEVGTKKIKDFSVDVTNDFSGVDPNHPIMISELSEEELQTNLQHCRDGERLLFLRRLTSKVDPTVEPGEDIAVNPEIRRRVLMTRNLISNFSIEKAQKFATSFVEVAKKTFSESSPSP